MEAGQAESFDRFTIHSRMIPKLDNKQILQY